MTRLENRFDWTDERVAELKRLWIDGKTSGEIAALWGVTRNTIIGKITRTFARGEAPARVVVPKQARAPKAGQPSAPASAPPKTSLAPVERKAPLPRALTLVPPAKAPAGRLVGILDVTGCKWPVHEDQKLIGGHAFCNAERAEGRPYCAYHIKNAGETYRMWTEAEDKAIREQWNRGRGRDHLAFTFKRTKHIVSIRARQLGLVS